MGAHASDKSDWLEWKSELDLNTRPGCFHVAKGILGMANRPVEIAARTRGGFGYVVVGSNRRTSLEVEEPDPSQWFERVEVYLKGQTEPPWEPMIVPMGGKDVLVVTVDPPLKPGRWLVHCHINHHLTNDGEEVDGAGGLTMVIEVTAEGSSR